METLTTILIIILVLGIIVGIIFTVDDRSGEQERKMGVSILIPSIIGVTLSIILIVSSNVRYKQGQIDALTNNIKYELKENPDKTKEWIEIKTK